MGAFIWLAGVVSLAYGFPAELGVEICNNIVDYILFPLSHNRGITPPIDSMLLPGIESEKGKLKNILVRGLSKVIRSGDCIPKQEGETPIIRISLLFTNISAKADFDIRELFSLDGSVEALIKMLNTTIFFAFDKQSKDLNFVDFKITEFETPTIQKITTEDETMNEAYRKLAQLALNRRKDTLIKDLEVYLRNYISKKIRQIKNALKNSHPFLFNS